MNFVGLCFLPYQAVISSSKTIILHHHQSSEYQGKITKARSPQGLTPDSFCPWLLFASYVLTL
ncbi:hypothetical protein KID79_13495, partial [Escherichia coli]|nr:hypothetical protein [Escherichia coli]MCQ0294487.1 hypothetical protein [Escherichia coli]MCQ0394492.1 hypothetical protein [Escherichia coli]